MHGQLISLVYIKMTIIRLYMKKCMLILNILELGILLHLPLIILNNDIMHFHFEQDGISDYFDEEGGSLRRAFLKAPLRFSRISSRFSYNRKHPILKIRRPHLGVDYVAPIGTPVHSVGDGIVSKSRKSRTSRKNG